MKTIFSNAFIYSSSDRQFFHGHILTEDGIITKISESAISVPGASAVDCADRMLVPGLIDIHTHGRAGFDFSTVQTSRELATLMQSYAEAGTTTVVPTLASAPLGEWERSVSLIEEYMQSGIAGARIAGIHLEGRYLSPNRRGAHAKELLSLPSSTEIISIMEAHPGIHFHVSLAPELEGAENMIRTAINAGATVGVAHTDCTYERAMEAVRWGACSFTHTFNAMSPLHHRMPGCVTAAMLADDAYAELICDGVHSHPAMSELLYRTKPANKLILVTDSMEATDCPDGSYRIAGLPVIVKNGRAETLEGALAGSTLTLYDAVRNLSNYAGCTFEDALLCATANPARMLGIYGTVGSIDEGKCADFLLLDEKSAPRPHTVVCGGNIQ